MLDCQYAYLVGSLLLCLAWLVVFVAASRSGRQRMLLYGFVFGLIGLTTAYLFTGDWWQPGTILGYRWSLEDALFGFANGGLAAVLPMLIFKEKSGLTGSMPWWKAGLPWLVVAGITTPMFLVFGWSSFAANCLGLSAALIAVWLIRKDLILPSLISGSLLTLISLPVYLLVIKLSPGWVEDAWLMNNLSGILVLGIPIEDLVWYFLAGAFISVIHPYYKNLHYE
jgi:hypothetical protein